MGDEVADNGVDDNVGFEVTCDDSSSGKTGIEVLTAISGLLGSKT